MGRCYKDMERCIGCGITYKQFRCYITSFKQARDCARRPDGDPRPVTRRTVLGKWHQLKKGHWEWHVANCSMPTDGNVTNCTLPTDGLDMA
jgi:hypothetical protein